MNNFAYLYALTLKKRLSEKFLNYFDGENFKIQSRKSNFFNFFLEVCLFYFIPVFATVSIRVFSVFVSIKQS